MASLDQLSELSVTEAALRGVAADLSDLALVVARSVTDTGRRTSVDDVVAAFRHSRQSLAELPDD